MKLHAPLLISTLSACVSASAKASIYTFDRSESAASPPSELLPTLSREDAKLFLAQRLGLSRHQRLGNANDDTLDFLNAFGGSQAPLFSDREGSLRRLLVVVEGLENPGDALPHPPTFAVQPSESDDTDWKGLIHEFLNQDNNRRGGTVSCTHTGSNDDMNVVQGGISSNNPLGSCSFATRAGSDENLSIVKADPTFVMKQVFKTSLPSSYLDDSTAIFHVSLEALTAGSKTSTTGPQDISKLKEILSEIALSKEQERTLIFVPHSPWTRQSKAKTQKMQEKRANMEPRVSPKEAPMSITHALKNSKPSPEAIGVAQKPMAPKTTIPSCWASEQACIEKTQDCSGHGSCNKKYTEKVSSDEDGPECWACQCSSTVVKLEGGATKTTYWGGPACQKKDISVPFLLFAGFSVAAMALVSWGIGMLYSMGQEDLPSVLGAGVAPVARK